MTWVLFIGSSILLVIAAIFLARYADVIALRTGLGGMFIGTILLAGATSLPELLTAINALQQDLPNLAAGNMLGSCMFNMFLLGLLDMTHWKHRILRQVAMRHALTGGLATMLLASCSFFILADIKVQVAWVGLDSLVIIALYFFGLWALRANSRKAAAAPPEEIPPRTPSLLHAILGFLVATGVLVAASPWLVRSSAEIAALTGLGTGFVGAVLVGTVTSLPEAVAVIAATRLGAYDLAVGNLFGSNVFNIFALGLTDFFYLRGRFLGRIDPAFALLGLMALLLTNIGLIGNLARLERRLLFVEIDALIMVIGYIAGMWLLYSMGIGA